MFQCSIGNLFEKVLEQTAFLFLFVCANINAVFIRVCEGAEGSHSLKLSIASSVARQDLCQILNPISCTQTISNAGDEDSTLWHSTYHFRQEFSKVADPEMVPLCKLTIPAGCSISHQIIAITDTCMDVMCVLTSKKASKNVIVNIYFRPLSTLGMEPGCILVGYPMYKYVYLSPDSFSSACSPTGIPVTCGTDYHYDTSEDHFICTNP